MTCHTVSILGSFNRMSWLPPAKRWRVHGLGHDGRRRTFSRMAVGGAFVLRVMPGGTIQPAQQAAARSRFGYVGRCDSTNTTTGGTFVLWVMPDGTIHPAQQPAARSCFGACRAVRFIRHNNRRRVCASGHAKRYDSSSTTTGGAFVILGMPGSTIHPTQQPEARSCFGSCRMARFIRHNKQRRDGSH